MDFNPREFEFYFITKGLHESVIKTNFINPTEGQLKEAGMTDHEFNPKIYEKVFCRINNLPFSLEEQLEYIFG